MSYEITKLSDQLIYVQLKAYPSVQDANRFLKEYQHLIESAEQKIYFIMDFRLGMFTQVAMLRKAAALTEHENFGASIGFGGNAIKQVFGDIFGDDAQNPDDVPNDILNNIDEVFEVLERLAPGITEGIDMSLLP